MAIADSQNWYNLEEWCKRAQLRGDTWAIPRPTPQSIRYSPTMMVIYTAQTLVANLRRRGCSWEECEAALDNHRIAVGAFDERWLELLTAD